MRNISKSHHYLSQFYLAGFTNTGAKDGNLFVHDLIRKSTRKDKPINVGCQNHYNTQQAEKNFGYDFETPAAKILRNIIKTQNFPTTIEETAYLFLFILFQAFRVPMVRDYEAKNDKNNLINRLHYLAKNDPSTLNLWNRILKEENIDFTGYDFSNKDIRKQIDWKNIDVNFPTQWHIDNLLDLMSINLNSLFNLDWKMYIADNTAEDFICTDKPVICLPKTNSLAMPHRLVIPDFKEDTIVVFPLTRHIALMGETNNKENFCVFEADDRFVATINGLLLSNPSYIRIHKGGNPIMRYVYSAKNDFNYLQIDSSIGNKDNFFASL